MFQEGSGFVIAACAVLGVVRAVTAASVSDIVPFVIAIVESGYENVSGPPIATVHPLLGSFP